MPNDLPDWSSTMYQPDVSLSGSPVAYTDGFTSATLTIPNGVHILSIVLPGFVNISLITITGVQSGTSYLAETPNMNIYQKQYFCIIPQTVDTQITVDISSGATGNAYISGILAPIAVAALPQNPAPWQAPNRAPLKVAFNNPGPSGSAVLIPAQADAESIWLHSFTHTWTQASASVVGNFQDSSPQAVMSTAALTAGAWVFADWKGARLTSGASFEFVQTGAAAAASSECIGTITYSVF